MRVIYDISPPCNALSRDYSKSLELWLRLVAQLFLTPVQYVDAVYVDPIVVAAAVYLVPETVLRSNHVVSRTRAYVVAFDASLHVVVVASAVKFILTVAAVNGVRSKVTVEGVFGAVPFYLVGTASALYGITFGRTAKLIVTVGAAAVGIADLTHPILGQGHPCGYQ